MTKRKVELIPPDAYPQMVSKAQAADDGPHPAQRGTAVTASRVIEDSGEILRDAVRAYVERAGRSRERFRTGLGKGP